MVEHFAGLVLRRVCYWKQSVESVRQGTIVFIIVHVRTWSHGAPSAHCRSWL